MNNKKVVQRPPMKMSKDVFFRLFSYLKPYKGRLIVSFFMIVLYVLGNVGGTAMLTPLIAGLDSTNTNPTFLWFTFDSKAQFLGIMISILLSMYVVAILANYVLNRMFIHISSDSLYRMRVDLFNHMQKLPISFFDSHTHGDLMSHFTNDIDVMSEFYSRVLPSLVQCALQVIAVVVSIALNLSILFANIDIPIGLSVSKLLAMLGFII